MLMNYKEMNDKYVEDGYTVRRIFRNDRWHNTDVHTPLRLSGVVEYIGYAEIWNEVGTIEHIFKMYRSSKGHGTIKYDDRKELFG